MPETTARVRPQWQTVRRPDIRTFAVALAKADSTCVCGGEVVADEPIMCVGAYVVQDEAGRRTVDLTGAEWRCQRCVGAVVADG